MDELTELFDRERTVQRDWRKARAIPSEFLQH